MLDRARACSGRRIWAVHHHGKDPDVDRHVAAVKQLVDAGFTEIALVHVGADSQADFIAWAAAEPLPALARI